MDILCRQIHPYSVIAQPLYVTVNYGIEGTDIYLPSVRLFFWNNGPLQQITDEFESKYKTIFIWELNVEKVFFLGLIVLKREQKSNSESTSEAYDNVLSDSR